MGTLITEKLVDIEQSMNSVQVELPKLMGAATMRRWGFWSKR
jgi:hypothetical protein